MSTNYSHLRSTNGWNPSSPDDSSWDRRYLASRKGQRHTYTGVIIDKLPYSSQVTQLIIASIQSTDLPEPLRIDHVAIKVTPRVANHHPLYQPIRFTAEIQPYQTHARMYVPDLTHPVVVQLANYTLAHLRRLQDLPLLPYDNHVLTCYCNNRLILLDKHSDIDVDALRDTLLAAPNDGTREATLNQALYQLRAHVNRVTIHQALPSWPHHRR